MTINRRLAGARSLKARNYRFVLGIGMLAAILAFYTVQPGRSIKSARPASERLLRVAR